jgi:hypothetical protein
VTSIIIIIYATDGHHENESILRKQFSKIVQLQNCKFTLVLYDSESHYCGINLMEEHRLRVLKNEALRRIFGRKEEGATGGWGNLYNESFVICTVHQIILGQSNQGGFDG